VALAPDPASGEHARPRILAVVSHFPMPQNHGDALRRLMVLQSLAPLGRLTAACVVRRETTERDIAELRAALPGAHVLTAPLTPVAGPQLWAKVARTVRGVLLLQPPWLDQQWSGALRQQIEHSVRQDGPFDAVVLVGEASGRYAALPTGGRRAWDKSNVLVGSELGALAGIASVPARLRALATLAFSYAFERRVLRRADAVWVTSAEEGDRLRRYHRRAASAVIPSMITPPGRRARIDPAARVVVWVSTFSYTPNWDGLLRFLSDNAAYLTESGTTVRVAGARASAAQEAALRAFPFVDFRGFVDDVTTALDGASVAVVPVWAGAGVKLKTLTFLAHGVPVISTEAGMEGIPHSAAAAVVTTSGEFAAALRAATPQVLLDAAERGLDIIAREFSPAAFGDAITTAMTDLLGERTTSRQDEIPA
jgi:glycosyltransferase involved in cell wall biosynthesis